MRLQFSSVWSYASIEGLTRRSYYDGMMIDFNVRDDWPADEPRWIKSLVSSLSGPQRPSACLPLTVVVEEILKWVALASGQDAWKNGQNRQSLKADLEQSLEVLGPKIHSHLRAHIASFQAALTALDGSGPSVLKEPPGRRTHAAWTDVTTTGQALLIEMAGDTALSACWEDLVDAAHNVSREDRQHQAISNLLFEQLMGRRLDAKEVFGQVAQVLSYGRPPSRRNTEKQLVPLEERLAAARAILLAPVIEGNVVVWLGYSGGRIDHSVQAGAVTFMQANWFVPNANATGQDFEHKEELSKIVKLGMFRVAKTTSERSAADILARVDLGTTTAAGAESRAKSIVNALLTISIHWSGGVRPVLSQTAILIDGAVILRSRRNTLSAPAEDSYGRNMTAESIRNFAPMLGSALAREELPQYLAAAVETQTTAEAPYSRERMLQAPEEADMRAAVPLQDRVVQYVAAYAAIPANDLFGLLLKHWPAARWESDVELAVSMCLLGGGPNWQRIEDLQGAIYSTGPEKPWLVVVADNEKALLDSCRVESERMWIGRMIRSVSDPDVYRGLIQDYKLELDILRLRRSRTRNALVHGNPVEFPIVDSVASIANFLGRESLRVGLQSFITAEPVPMILEYELGSNITPLLGETSVADFWRAKAANL